MKPTCHPSPRPGRLVAWLTAIAICLPLIQAQLHAADFALELDGAGAHLRLPPHVFDAFTESTIEAWVQWDAFGGTSPDRTYIPDRLYNYGAPRADLSLATLSPGTLWFFVAGPGEDSESHVHNLLQTNQWYHLAATTGPAGMHLYVNARLVASNALTHSFSTVSHEPGALHLIGQTVTALDSPTQFDGRLTEFRVWNVQRSQSQIATSAPGRLTGREPHLAGLWTFDDQTARDSTTNHYHGEPVGSVAFSPVAVPDSLQPLARITVHFPTEQPAAREPTILLIEGPEGLLQSHFTTGRDTFHTYVTPHQGPFQLQLTQIDWTTNLSGLTPAPGADIELILPPHTPSNTNHLPFVSALADLLNRDPTRLSDIPPPVLVRLAPHLKPLAPVLAQILRVGRDSERFKAALLLWQMDYSSVPVVEGLWEAAQNESGLTRGMAIASLNSLPVPDEFSHLYDKKFLTASSLFAGLLLPFALIHGLLFLLHPSDRGNLYYALFTLAAAAVTWILGGRQFSFAALLLCLLVFLLFSLLFLYSLFYGRILRAFWLFLALTGAALVSLAVQLSELEQFTTFSLSPDHSPAISLLLPLAAALLAALLMLLEMVRTLAVSLWRHKPGAWLMGLGFASLISGGIVTVLLWVLLFTGSLTAREFLFWGQYFPHAGILAFVVCASIQLARNLAHTYREVRKANQEVEKANTQLAAAHRQADQANQFKSQFLAGMSHELRTPLNAIIGYSELLEEEASGTEPQSFLPDLKKIQAAARHQLMLVNDILDLSKIEAGKMDVYIQEFDLSKLLDEVRAITEPLALKNQNQLLIHAPDAGRLYSDPTKLRQILFNLLNNAAKFTRNGTIELHCTRHPANLATGATAGQIRFEVTDTGIGMTPEQVARLFQPFVQADSSIQATYGGTGLGLSLTKRFCEMLGGTLEVRSIQAKGSTFTVSLPAGAPLTSESESRMPAPRTSHELPQIS